MNRTQLKYTGLALTGLISVTQVAASSSWWWKSPNHSFTIAVTSTGPIAQTPGQTTRIKGEIDWLHAYSKGSSTPPKGAMDQTDIQFYYPDLANDVTAQVRLDKKKFTFEYDTPAFSANSKPQFTAVIGKPSGNLRHLLAIEAKLERRITALEGLLERERNKKHHTLSQLEDLIACLKRVRDQIAAVIGQKDELIAQRTYPILVADPETSGESAISRHQTLAGGISIDLSFDRGAIFEGESTTGKARLVNLRDKLGGESQFEHWFNKKDKWIVKYIWNGQTIKQEAPRPFNPGEEITFSFDTGRTNDAKTNLFEVQLYKDGPGRWDTIYGHLELPLRVAPDNTAPTWLAGATPDVAHTYTQEPQSFSATLKDVSGKIDLAAFSAKLTGTTATGELINQDLTATLAKISSDFDSKVLITHEIDPALKEGSYKISATGKDLAGNSPSTLVIPFWVDRSEPEIALVGSLPQTTATPLIHLTASITDLSPVSVSIMLNDTLVQSQTANTVTADLSLVEGVNFITLKAVDAAQNQSEQTFGPIFFDTTPPILSIQTPLEGAPLASLSIGVTGSANEALSSISANGTPLNLSADKKTFSGTVIATSEGQFTVTLLAKDTVGNETQKQITVTITPRLLRESLISLIPDPEVETGIIVVGAQGAAYPNSSLVVRGGFFNSATGSPNLDGSFAFKLGFASKVTILATALDLNREDQVEINYQIDTRFSGLVMDTDKRPLPHVKIYFANRSDISPIYSDAGGMFVVGQSVSGDQTVIIDGTEVQDPCQTCLPRKFNPISLKVTLGLKQANALTRPIYLSPEYLDGTQVNITQVAGGTVSNPHAPGVTLSIPPQAIDSEEVQISMSLLPSEVSLVDLPNIGNSDTIINFEPSGLSFKKPVELTIPNENDLPAGWDFIVMSFDSRTGTWNPDGVAEVSDDRTVVRTKPGMGIKHFSQAFMLPTGPRIVQAGSQDRPGADSFNGALALTVPMPSYKAVGQEVSPALNYKSSWAKPSVLVTNIFDLPQIDITNYEEIDNSKVFGFRFVEVEARVKIKDEVTKITSRFASGNISSDLIDLKLPAEGLPEKAAISYSFELKDLPTGVYPYTSAWEVHYRHTRVVTPFTRTRKYGLFGPMITEFLPKQDYSFDQIYPSALTGSLHVQNKIKSDAGQGWRISGSSRILNPEESKVFIEEGDGSISTYALNNTIDTVINFSDRSEEFTVKEGARIDWPNLIVSRKDASKNVLPVRYNLKTPASSYVSLGHIEPLVGNMVHNWTHTYACGAFNLDTCKTKSHIDLGYTVKRRPGDYLILPTGQIVTTSPRFHSIYIGDGSPGGTLSTLAGQFQTPPLSQGGSENPSSKVNQIQQNSCIGVLGEACQQSTRRNAFSSSTGQFPLPGIALTNTPGDTISTVLLNNPRGMAIHPVRNSIAVADYGNHRVLELNISTGKVSIVAGNGQTVSKLDEVPATNSSLVKPTALAYDRAGQLFILTEEGRVRFVDLAGRIHTIGGLPHTDPDAFYSDSSLATRTSLSSPSGMALDEERAYLYVSDTGHNRIVAFDLTENANHAFLVAGTPSAGFSGDGGPALSAALSSPTSLGLDEDRNLLIVDSGNERIRRVVFQATTLAKVSYLSSTEDFSKLERDATTGLWTRTTREGAVISYDQSGLCTEVRARNGRSVKFEFDDQRRLAAQVDPVGGRITYSYSGGKLRTITDPANRTTQFSYNAELLTEIIYPDGTKRRYTYGDDGLLESETNERGLTTRYFFNEWNRLSSVVRPDNSKLIVNDQGSGTAANSYTGGNAGELKSVDSDEFGNSITDGRNVTTTFKKDQTGFISSVKDSEGTITRFDRNLKGQVTKIYFDFKDNGTPDDESDDYYHSATSYGYNEFGERISETDSLTGITVSKNYNSFGQVTTETSPRGLVTTHTYDSSTGLETTLSDNVNGSFGRLEYNHPLKLLTKEINSLGIEKSYQYDARGNLSSETRAVDDTRTATTSYKRDAAGNIIEVKNAKEEVTKYEYDIWNRVIAVVSPNGDRTEYAHSETGQLVQVTDPKQNTIVYEYDLLDQLVKTTDQLGRVTIFNYDANGNLLLEKDPNGNEKRYEYNARNDLIKKILPDDLVEIEYDPQGRLLSSRNTLTEIKLRYDSTKTKVEQITSGGRGARSDLPLTVLDFAYDEFEGRKSFTSPIGKTTYDYDKYGRVVSLINPMGEFYGFEYDPLNREKKRIRPGSQTTFSYDRGNGLKAIDHAGSGGVIARQNYLRDLVGNRISSTRTGIGELSFLYDSKQQLTNVSSSDPAKVPNETFSYDALSNRTADVGGLYAYDDKSQKLVQDYRSYYFYDANGNLVSRQAKGLTGEVTQYFYNSENQLTGVKFFETGTPQASLFIVGNSVPYKEVFYTYDVLGRRIEKKIVVTADSSKNQTRRYAYDGTDIIIEYDENNDVLASHTHRLNQTDSAIDDILSTNVTSVGVSRGLAGSSQSYQMLKDGLGSVTEVADNSGNLIQRYNYGAFGNVTGIENSSGEEVSTPAFISTFTYSGREYDQETNLYYHRARYYDPAMGRFLQMDPEPGDPMSPSSVVNRYTYSLNSPMMYTDPTGEMAFLAVVAVSIVVGGIISGAIQALNGGSFVAGFITGAVGAAVFTLGAFGLGALAGFAGISTILGVGVTTWIGIAGAVYSGAEAFNSTGNIWLALGVAALGYWSAKSTATTGYNWGRKLRPWGTQGKVPKAKPLPPKAEKAASVPTEIGNVVCNTYYENGQCVRL